MTGCTEGEHVKLRKQVAQELQHNAISIASSIVTKAKFCVCNMKISNLLVGSMLHDDTLDTVTSTMDRLSQLYITREPVESIGGGRKEDSAR